MKRAGFFLFLAIVLYFIFLIRQDIIDNLELKAEKSRLESDLRQEERKAKMLEQRVKVLQQDVYLEQLARTKLGLIKKGETAYKVIVGGEK